MAHASTAGLCAIDFGTSNSAIALPGTAGDVLVPLEAGQPTMPTAVFYAVEGLAAHEAPRRLYGRAAVAAYVEGVDGRLMRSMKSILGSTLADQATDVGAGHSVRYADVISGYLQQLKARAENASGQPLHRVVLGRPVYFVDDDPVRDARAQQVLERAARDVGFVEVDFQYEPIAAALDYEAGIDQEQLVLVGDIGGGTSDFSLVRVGPRRRTRIDRRDDILANHGVHVAGTDFDRHLELAAILPTCGYRTLGPVTRDGESPREVPSPIFFDLATWHLVNTLYAPARMAEARRLRVNYAEPRLHDRLMRVLEGRLGHALVARAEAAKIALGDQSAVAIDLSDVEPQLAASLQAEHARSALADDLARIEAAAAQTLALAGVTADAVDVLYLTGGSTGWRPLADRLAQALPRAQVMRGDPFASVARGLGLHALRASGAVGAAGATRAGA